MNDGSATCCICGKPLTKDISITRGMGDICAARYALFNPRPKSINDGSPQSDYVYYIIEIQGKKVGIVIDKDTSGYMSVTNNIDRVCDEIGAESIIYRDSEGVWDYWSEKMGFKSLALHGIPATNIDTAIEVAKARIFGDIGGLFNTDPDSAINNNTRRHR